MAHNKKVDIAQKKLEKGNLEHHEALTRKKVDDYIIKSSPPSQHPWAAVLSCADSRVIPERIFHAGEGELFVCRVAGNIADTSIIASMEYAVAKLEVPIIIVLGHQACGAVESTLHMVQRRLDLGFNLNQLAAHIIPAVNRSLPENPKVNNLAEAIKRNAILNAQCLLDRSLVLSKAHKEGSVIICAGYYHITGRMAGKVEYLGPCI